MTSILRSKPRSAIGKDGITRGRSAGRLQWKPMKLHQILVQFERVDFWNPCHLQWLVVIKMAEIQPLESVSFPMRGFDTSSQWQNRTCTLACFGRIPCYTRGIVTKSWCETSAKCDITSRYGTSQRFLPLQMFHLGLEWLPCQLEAAITLPKANVAPKNRPSQAKSSLPTINFQVLECTTVVILQFKIILYTTIPKK